MKKITDRDCVPVMLGTWAWGDKLSFGGEYPEEELSVLFNRAVLEGFKMWDTAYVYGYGKSEGILGAFTGGVTAAAGGIAAAVFFGYLAALIFKPKMKQ